MTIKPLIAALLALGSIAAAPAADAQRYGNGDPRFSRSDRQDYRGQVYRGGDDGQRGRPGYDQRGDDGRPDRRCSRGTSGAFLGALTDALGGRAIQRSSNQGYCR